MPEFVCDSKYLAFPVNRCASKKRLLFHSDGKLVLDLLIALDPLDPDGFYYVNMERFTGLRMLLSSDPHMEVPLRKSDVKYENETLYREKHRPLFHFTPARGWLNDPNGMVFAENLHHMFFQHNPVGRQWDNMHWGHAVSRDLVTWQERECALYPDELGTMYSGSAVVDCKNVSGLRSGTHDPILVFYTAAGGTSEMSKDAPHTQCLAYSTDGGLSFGKYAQNPIIDHIAGGNRDPKVEYDAKHDVYVMSLYLDCKTYALFVSHDLLHWEKTQEFDFEGATECPDLYPLALDGDASRVKWVFSGASDVYRIGTFDGRVFTPETPELPLHHNGHTSYAAQSWQGPDGRRLRVSWNRCEAPADTFSTSMSVPCEMTLRTTADGPRLFIYPVPELERLYTSSETRSAEVSPDAPFVMSLGCRAFDLSLEFTLSQGRLDASFLGTGFSCDGEFVYFGQAKLPLHPKNGIIRLRVLADRPVLEVFSADGRAYAFFPAVLDDNLPTLRLRCTGRASVKRLELSAVGSMWEQ